ncbi:DNA ligase 1-like [Helianthus annuus]|uniref:DNA ligase 1-like n=1 Tax=Helianthus annuus TaxID=4232 RepID=UPI000B8FCBAA|nr:DNA ligase 1-like [Helianthus annuus]
MACCDQGFWQVIYMVLLIQGDKIMAEMKVRTKEEILKEKTEREIFFAGCRIDKMHEEYEEAVSNKRWDKKKECYVNKNGEPVVHKKDIVHDEVLAVIPLSGEYYSNVEKDKTYMKKVAEIVKVEAVKEEDVKTAEEEKEKKDEAVGEEAVTKEQQVSEEEMKKKEVEEVKMESSVEMDDDVGDDASVGEEKEKDVDQTKKAENAEVPITKITIKNMI